MNELIEFGITNQHSAGYNSPPTDYLLCFGGSFAPAPVLQVTFPITSDALEFDSNSASWVLEAGKKLESLAKLRRNWDSYDGLPLSPNARRVAFDAIGWLKNQDLPTPAVVLGSGGTVHLEWYSKGRELEIGFESDGRVDYCRIDADGRAEEGQADIDMGRKLTRLTEWLRNGK